MYLSMFLVCEEIENVLQLQAIKRFVSGVHPSLAVIGRKTRSSFVFKCTGALIGKRFVLTSGRCLSVGAANLVRLANRSDKTSAMERSIKVILRIFYASLYMYTRMLYFLENTCTS